MVTATVDTVTEAVTTEQAASGAEVQAAVDVVVVVLLVAESHTFAAVSTSSLPGARERRASLNTGQNTEKLVEKYFVVSKKFGLLMFSMGNCPKV